jgi:stress response protein YsnF
MATTVIGKFENERVHDLLAALRGDAGLKEDQVRRLEGGPDEAFDQLVGVGVGRDDARGWVDALQAGQVVVLASGSRPEIERAQEVMERFESDPEIEGDEAPAADGGDATVVPEVEEELAVSKRQVRRGGKRLVTSVSEKPVERTVTMREETVAEVERRPADRELRPEEAESAFEEKEVEIAAMGEELEVEKEARVTGEVVVEKAAEEHEEKIRDKVRKTEVEVQDVEPERKRD